MLRASSLGLTFTYGISRASLLQRHRVLHKQHVHEAALLFGLPRSRSTTEVEVAKEVAVVEDTSHSSSTFGPSIYPPPSEDNTSPVGTILFPHHDHTPRDTRSLKPLHHLRPEAKPVIHSVSAKKCGLRPSVTKQWAFQEHRRRQALYDKLANAEDIEEAWRTYQELLLQRPPHVKQLIPHKYLHCFAALLVARTKWQPSQKTRTQTVFHRLLSVLSTIYYSGGQVRLWEWNALLECSGSGWRKTRMDDFHSALNIYRDMVANRAPGASLSKDSFPPLHDESRVASQPVDPDIVTYTTLLSIAGRTLNEPTLQEAEELLAASGHQPNRITYLAYIRYYTRRGRLAGVRSVLSRMKLNDFELGIDGINACIWAYGRNGRLDIATLIYRILRHRLQSEHDPHNVDELGDIQGTAQQLFEFEGIVVPAGLKPNAITYYTLIQVYAYHGRMQRCLTAFEDMMTSPEPVTGPLHDMDVVASEPTIPNPVLPIFRAIFLGFARHTELPGHPSNVRTAPHHQKRPTDEWTLDTLHTLFEQFIELPQNAKPNSRTAYWLLVAYAIASGYDRVLLRDVWERLSRRYGNWWDGRVHKFRDKIYAAEFDEAYFEGVRMARDRRER
ncbi:hypothetical protein C8Q80DRAFT_537458 [Daedaleopsis nitida]|nr:hypothetical protein C8Q80DRAFT_537458 [Daedaleopsis nitida]